MGHDKRVLFVAGVMGEIELVPEPLVLYRQHGASYSGWLEREPLRTLGVHTVEVRLLPDVRANVTVAIEPA